MLVLLFALILHAQAAVESQLQTQFSKVLDPYFNSGENFKFLASKNVTLKGRAFLRPEAKGTIVLVNGYGETMEKYAEVIYDLTQRGYSVFVYDHRGQGESELLLRNFRKGYLDQFSYLVDDLDIFIKKIVQPRTQGPLYFLGCSMGALTGARYFETHPQVFTAAVLIAPPLQIKLHGLPETPVRWFLNTAAFIGHDRFFIEGPTDPQSEAFAKNILTHSQPRYEILNQGVLKENPQRSPWGATARWLLQVMRGGKETYEARNKIDLPLLMLQGLDDALVEPKRNDEFCSAIKSCQMQHFAGAAHEILMEQDSVRDLALSAIVSEFKPSNRAH